MNREFDEVELFCLIILMIIFMASGLTGLIISSKILDFKAMFMAFLLFSIGFGIFLLIKMSFKNRKESYEEMEK